MRPRKSNRNLPPCVYLKHNAYYLVKKGKWIRLGDTLPQALKALANRIDTTDEMMPALIQRWFDQATMSENTRKGYKTAVHRLAHAYAEFKPSEVTAHSVLAVMNHYKDNPGSANILRAVMLNVMEFAFREMIVDRNVVKDTSGYVIKHRSKLLTSAEVESIREVSKPVLKSIIDMLYLTGQRIGDILKIKLSDMTEDGIYVKQQKTGNELIIGWSPELRQAVSEAKALSPVRGLYLYHRGGHKLSYVSVRKLWDKARIEAGVPDAQMRDIRAKTATDARKQGLSSQNLLGHKSAKTTEIYLRDKEIKIATPVSIRQSMKKQA